VPVPASTTPKILAPHADGNYSMAPRFGYMQQSLWQCISVSFQTHKDSVKILPTYIVGMRRLTA
jgi:hypothetical protein